MNGNINILDIETVDLDLKTNELVIIDQTLLPGKTELIRLSTAKDIWEAINLLKVRGAPAIGVAAAIGMYVLASRIDAGEYSKDEYEVFYQKFAEYRDYLDSARPTAVNLHWALNRMDKLVRAMNDEPVSKILDALKQEALDIKAEDIWVCKQIGEYGLTLVKPGDGILTHCNAGKLAVCKYGTATAPIYLGHERGYNFKVYVDETRPLLQGARLTSYELMSAGIDVTLICDNMSGLVMRNGRIQAIFVGCDRVAANGDVANKIGTSMVATLAARYRVPFYVCAPTSTIDMDTAHGDDIRIEERPAYEVTDMWYNKPMAPAGIKVYNPAFDITDNELITAIITEYGIARAPYDVSLREIMDEKEAGNNKPDTENI